MLLSEHVHCAAVAFKMTEQVRKWICIRFCIKLEHYSVENYLDNSEGPSYGQLVIGSFIMTMCLFKHHVACRVFWWNIKSLRWLNPLQPSFGALRLLAFPKPKTTFERKEISDCWWDSEKYNRATDGNWERTCEAQRCLLWGGLQCHCPVYNVLVSCIFNTCLYFSYCMAGYLLDRLYTYSHAILNSWIFMAMSNPPLSPSTEFFVWFFSFRLSFFCCFYFSIIFPSVHSLCHVFLKSFLTYL